MLSFTQFANLNYIYYYYFIADLCLNNLHSLDLNTCITYYDLLKFCLYLLPFFFSSTLSISISVYSKQEDEGYPFFKILFNPILDISDIT